MRPLEGLLVVALEQAVAAPMCSRRLADAGARVIKLERPEGDFARGYDDVAHGQSSYFVWLNRGKESVVVDLGLAEDRRLFEALISRADVFIQNLKPGAIGRLGYPIAELCALNPRLVACSISGYGESGPYADRKAYDLLIQAESGLASVTGGPEAPSRIGVSVVDVGTGMTAYEAILEALFARERTGLGADLRVSMFDAMAEWMAVPMMHARYRDAPKRIGLRHPSVAPYGVFTCADGSPILIAIQNEREWRRFAADVLARPDLTEHPKFVNNIARIAHRAETDEEVQRSLAAIDTPDLLERLARHEIAFGLVSSVEAALAHPCLREVNVETPRGVVPMPAPAPIWNATSSGFARSARETPPIAARGVPALGADTGAVREEFLKHQT
ncbi:MAG: CaiB/BaiF CoA transferase family protein [Hyphomicrobiaceae bacterium]